MHDICPTFVCATNVFGNGIIPKKWQILRDHTRCRLTVMPTHEQGWPHHKYVLVNFDVFDVFLRLQTDIHLACEEWDRELTGVDWEPEMIVAKLPEFLQFVREVQEFISTNCK